jgi:hypothetical protein
MKDGIVVSLRTDPVMGFWFRLAVETAARDPKLHLRGVDGQTMVGTQVGSAGFGCGVLKGRQSDPGKALTTDFLERIERIIRLKSVQSVP